MHYDAFVREKIFELKN